MKELQKNVDRQSVVRFFRDTAIKEREGTKVLEDIIDEDDGGKRVLYVVPQKDTDIFLSSSLFKSVSELYPEHKLYVATDPKFKVLVEPNDYVYKVVDYSPQMEDVYNLEGYSNREGVGQPSREKLFDVVFLSTIQSQRLPSYTRNAKDKIAFDINY